MKQFNKIIITVAIISGFILIISNIMIYRINYKADNSYKVELNRIKNELADFEKANDSPPSDMSELLKYSDEEYDFIREFIFCKKGDTEKLSELSKMNHIVVLTDDFVYFIDLELKIETDKRIYIIVNIILIIGISFILLVLIYIKEKLIRPFNVFSQLPYEIAKGNMTMPLNERENKYFGKYIWGMNMLRENIEDGKKRELELIKEKKVLLMSLSHDIKTPLSAIKLYVKALERNLYNNEDKKKTVLKHINNNANEIEKYISEIVTASNEEFLDFEVENTNIYIRDVLDEISRYYKEKLKALQIEFGVVCENNCIIYACHNRMVEVIQNIIENAIKYGDGNRIGINAYSEEDEYIILIENTGCILDEKELHHVFDSFYRGSNIGKNSGSGLGLYICRELVHMMEGEIFAEIKEKENERLMIIKIILLECQNKFQ